MLHTYRSYFPKTEALRRLALTVPNTFQGHLRVARLVEKAHWDQARLHYRTASILSKSDPEILQAYGIALQCHRAFTTARNIWQQFRDVAPHAGGHTYLGLADALYGLKDDEGVARTLQQLVDRFPMQAEYHGRLANAYMQSNQTAEAEVAWKRAIDLPQHAATHYVGLARLYQSRGDLSGAILMMQRTASWSPDITHPSNSLRATSKADSGRERSRCPNSS